MEKSVSSLVVVLKRRSLPALAMFVAVIGGAVAYLVLAPSLYRASAQLILDDKRVSISELGRDLTQVPVGVPGGPSPLAEQAELVKSLPILERSLAKVFPVSQSKLTTKKFSKGLRVKLVPATNILVISYQAQDPILAAKLVNAVSQTMVEESAEQIRKEAANVRKFLQKEVPFARQRLQQAEAMENRYKQASGLISFADQSKSLVDSLATLEDEERTLVAQLQETRSRDASLRKITTTRNLTNAYASVRGGQDEQLQKLRTKLADLQTQIATVRLRFTENHPSLILLLQQQQALSTLYNRELARLSPRNPAISPNHVASDPLSQDLTSELIGNEIERLAVENKLKAVQSLKANLQTRLAQLPIQQQPLTVLTRQREEAAASLKLLQTKLEEARIAEAQLVGNIRIIEEAKPPTSPTYPKPYLVLGLATVLGSILAVGVVLLLEATDNTIHDTSETEEILPKIPLLGTLPSLPTKALNLQPAEGFLDDIALVEPYRMLLKTLEFRSSKKLRSIVITSTKSGEGKSVVVSHLAAVCAMLSRRTLIVDADLHRPMQHNLFNLPAEPGLSDAIAKERSLLDTVQIRDIENLSVLTCGELHPRPSQLLESEAMKSLIADAIEHYDFVIIDTPPLSVSADAATLGRYTNGVVLITRPSFTLKDILKKAVSELTQNQIPILGVVINGMTSQTEKSYSYLSRPLKHSTPPRDTVNSANGLKSK
ncbi:polysaccharide biosynthesis tyrosine autokinase [Desmonostoc muscorum LEGE 12446]|uniref:Polysaccharide biosynthesis tyrosine autokinase n=1 Tax=Desmonostoc muscorum LEGE 12446 TaxID=1828758 RepID=A0A8J6ZTH6_DESMC|nr:polysaccharide biosynthesis tyrosine autokinase [Desmonostoc muscorum]MCF2149955.1 polysaccharide biosynthesis tyrosine autokinase [Desmonostoc muscorum LEGE 12446]